MNGNIFITKKIFVKCLDLIDKQYYLDDAVHKALSTVFEDGSGFPMHSGVEEVLIALLTLGFPSNHKTDISFFVYDLDFGRNWTSDSILDANGKSIDFSTAEKLYDYLMGI